MYASNKVTITIKDVDISSKWRRKMKTLQKYESEGLWKACDIGEREVIYKERQVLQHDLNVIFHNDGWIRIFSGRDLDREDLAYLDRLFGVKAEIDVSDKGNIILDFHPNRSKSEYDKYPTFKTKDDIESPLFNKQVRLRN